MTRQRGKIVSVQTEAGKETKPQSHIHIELKRMLTPAQCAELQANLEQVANDVRFAYGRLADHAPETARL